ncbi:hypothetical protein SMGD1_1354 [Sulfurimonas gotlandica GD1]|jgi:hypothetical protein|uniref:Uncharacterized protein n=1 Tax=Sulfurimonas gotlandica (strain DSM 19862 / JCM 16533 / GD1) TaxID=929558 RepID=H1FSF0_SULGG|nr:hypothetical protein [Sulfurimonas gotlandica]EHP29878.1 hypothetical protein SMGD1_1354 [Sulfurimonas gotlandica GD1]
MTNQVEKATSGGDLLTWGIMFGLLVIVAAGLAIWDIKSRKE